MSIWAYSDLSESSLTKALIIRHSPNTANEVAIAYGKLYLISSAATLEYRPQSTLCPSK